MFTWNEIDAAPSYGLSPFGSIAAQDFRGPELTRLLVIVEERSTELRRKWDEFFAQ